jgi:hypothetical protein
VIAPVLLTLLAAGAIALAVGYGLSDFGAPGAGLMPAVAAALLLAASLATLRWERPRLAWPPGAARTAYYIAGLILLLPAIRSIGMLAALGIFAFTMLFWVERLPLSRSGTIAFAMVAGCWLLFGRLLSVPLPQPMIW